MSRTKILRPLLVIVGVAVVGLSAYAFRSQLGGAPVIGKWFRSAGPPTTDLQAGTAVDAAREPAEVPGQAAASDEATPPGGARAEVVIDPRRQQLIGVRTIPAERKRLVRSIRAVGLVRYDETRLADVNLKLEGWIDDLYVDYTGKLVKTGEPLFTIYSPELVTTQNEYLLALKTREQLKQSQIADAREYAERLVQAARQRLELWDLPADQLQALDERREPQRTMLFRSPISGFVIEKQALKGQHVMPGMSLYKIADLSGVWVEADLYEQEIGVIRPGQRAEVTLDAYPDEEFRGRVIYIYPFVEEQTRTVKVRFELPNPGGRLKPGMYANINLEAPVGTGVIVPANALLDSGTQQIVFVSQGDGYFEPRRVKVGQRLGEAVQILDGIREGELVATGATFFIDSESQLRAALQGFETAPETTTAPRPRERLDITFRSQPDPPRTGDNTFEVAVRDPAGQPIADAEVSVAFYMAAMPTMNMPAMRSEARLPAVGGGMYRGSGQVMMAGRWDVTVTVSRSGQRLDSKHLTVVAR